MKIDILKTMRVYDENIYNICWDIDEWQIVINEWNKNSIRKNEKQNC